MHNQTQYEPLSNEEIGILAMYNAEKARGILHSYLWVVKMRKLQQRFDETKSSTR